MRFSPIPRGVYPGFSALDPEALAARGIRLVLADLDNTLVPYRVAQPSPQLTAWRDALAAQGIALFILSNSRKPGRAQNFAQALGVPFQGRSGKPRRRGHLQAMERMGCTPAQTVMVGDQIFTDILGANLCGMRSVLLDPLSPDPSATVRFKRSLEGFLRPHYTRLTAGEETVKSKA